MKKDDVQVLSGSPEAILNKLAHEIRGAMVAARIPVSPIHLLAMLHLMTSTYYNLVTKPEPEDKDLKVFTTESLMTLFVRNLTNTPFTKEEMRQFEENFVAVVESMGGMAFKRGEPGFEQANSGHSIVAPSTDQVH